MMRRVTLLIRDTRASSAAEFALVLPLLIIFLLGIIDVGRLMWTWNKAEKATQMGVRYAVATDMIPNGLAAHSFVNGTTITQGDPIPDTAFDGASCYIASGAVKCDCKTACSGITLVSSSSDALTAFNGVVSRMQRYMPQISAASVQVDYDYSGLGYAGDPYGSDVSPLVRVSIRPNTLSFRPTLLMLFGGTISLPSFSAALTMEDGQGTVSN